MRRIACAVAAGSALLDSGQIQVGAESNATMPTRSDGRNDRNAAVAASFAASCLVRAVEPKCSLIDAERSIRMTIDAGGVSASGGGWQLTGSTCSSCEPVQ